VGGIISLWWAASFRYGGRHHPVIVGDIDRNQQIHRRNSSKWAKIMKCSQDTALRDIDDLITRRILVKDAAGGRSTSYSLVDETLNYFR
jgi:Fic family protein